MDNLQKKIEDGTPQVLAKVQENRRAAVTALEKAISLLNDEPNGHDQFRDKTEDALEACQVGLEAINSVCDMLTADLVNVIRNMSNLSSAMMQIGAANEVTLQTLIAKGVITDEEYQSTFKRLKEEAMLANSIQQAESTDQPST